MLGGVSPITTVLGSAPAPDADTAALKSYARTAASIGLHLLLIEPGGKKPVDMRSPVQRRTDDGLAKDAARAEGRADWDRVKSMAGVYLATSDTKLLDRYIERYRKTYGENTPVNFGVAVGPSKLIVVDCDTAAQVRAFLSDFEWNPDTPPTVRSPGQRDEAGNWAHSDGGHFYFTTDSVMPEQSGSLTGPGGYAVLWANRYVLIPPSVRPEGPYRLVGQDFPAPAKLIGAVTNAAYTKAQARLNAEVSPEVATAVDQWAETITWADILAPAGWALSARQDNCGCDIWTAPGDHASPKSATAHDTACSLGRYTTENAPLHIWTDNPGPELEAWIAERGTKTLSRLQAVAALEYGGKVGDAMREMRVMPDDSGALGFGRDLAHELGAPSKNLDAPLEDSIFASGGQTKRIQTAGAGTIDMRPKSRISGPIPEPLSVVPLRVGDRFDPEHTAMLEAQGFTGSVTPDGVYTFAAPESDGRILTITVDGDDQIQKIIIRIEDTETESPLITLTPLPDPEPAAAPPGDLFAIAGQLPPEGETPVTETDEVEQVTGVPHIMPFAHWREYPAPEFVIDGLLEHRALTAVIGAPGVGKSGCVLDMAASIALGKRWMGRSTLRQRVLYLPGEGLSGAVQRLLAWESAHDSDVGEDLLVGDSIIQVAASPQAWAAVIQKMLEFDVGLTIIDTFARASVGLEENSATDVGRAIARFDQVRKATGSGLMVVHHTAKSSSSGRGSSALNGALDTELLIEDGLWWDDGEGPCPGRQLSMRVTKQKNAASPEDGIAMLALPFGNSFIMTGPSGLVDDPLDLVATVRAVIPEPIVNIAIRLQDFATRFRGQGITRSELAYGVPPDDYTNQRRDAKTAWRLKVAEAIDLGIRYGLLETFTGQATGARYIDGPCGAEAARERWAQESLAD
jgi:hypothetical protein